MVWTDTVPRVIIDGWGKVPVLLAAAANCGDLLAVSSNTYVLADGDNAREAILIAGENGASGDTITAYRGAVLEGAFAGLSGDLGDLLWLSATAGDYGLVPTGCTLLQRVGWVQDATHVVLHPQAPKVITIALSLGISAGTGASTEIEAYSPVVGRIMGAQFINESGNAYASRAEVFTKGFSTSAAFSSATTPDGETERITTVDQTYAELAVGSTITWLSGGGDGSQDQWCIIEIAC